jgi:hypothetical protein
MSASQKNNSVVLIGLITGIVTIAIQIISIGEYKGQSMALQQSLREDVNGIKQAIRAMEDKWVDSERTSIKDIADLKARVGRIESAL